MAISHSRTVECPTFINFAQDKWSTKFVVYLYIGRSCMNIKLARLSILIGALLVAPVATSAVISQDEATAAVTQPQSVTSENKSEASQSDHEHKAHAKNKQSKDQHKDKHNKKYKHGDKGEKHHHHSYVHNVAMQAEALDLSDEQLGKIVRLHLNEDHEAHHLLKKDMKQTMKAFRKAVAQLAVDEEALRKLGQEHIDSFNAMVKHHVEERQAVLNILTPEQVGKLKEIKVEEKGKEKEHQHEH